MKKIYPIDIFGVKNIGIEEWMANYYAPVTGKEYQIIYENIFHAYTSTLKKYDDEIVYWFAVSNIKLTLFISRYVFDLLRLSRLKEAGYEFEAEEIVGGYVVSYGIDNCPFLDDKTGCILPKDLKPLDCTVFPLLFKFKNNRLEIYVSGECPHLFKLNKEQIDESIKELEKGLKNWSDDSKRAYTRRIETTRNSEIKLEEFLNGMPKRKKP